MGLGLGSEIREGEGGGIWKGRRREGEEGEGGVQVGGWVKCGRDEGAEERVAGVYGVGSGGDHSVQRLCFQDDIVSYAGIL